MKNTSLKRCLQVLLGTIVYMITAVSANGQTLDERLVPNYTLPSLLTLNSGKKVTTKSVWENKRRPEIIALLKKEFYGVMPGKPKRMRFDVFDLDTSAMGGTAIRKQIKVTFDANVDSVFMDILMYIPKKLRHKAPVIVGLNFGGNQEVTTDSAVKITHSWVPKKAAGAINHHATSASRGVASSVWPIDKMLAEGFASATVYYGDIDPDYDDDHNAVQSLYPELQNRQDNFSSVGAWAWGLSRVMDYLETDPDIGKKEVVLTGLSRLGKAAIWAGATDERFAMLISTESGKGGDALFQRQFGESVDRINKVFPQWFCHNFGKYAGKINEMPFDQHEVLALMAPRPLYVGSAEEDLNEDPKGEFLALKATEPVYRLYGFPGLPTEKMPAVNQAIHGVQLAYHLREGKHGITSFDWENYFEFIKRHLAEIK